MKPIKLNNESEDETLVRFLQTYQPSPPIQDTSVQDKLINSITKTKQESTNPKKGRNWLFLSTLTTIALVVLSGNTLKSRLLPQAQLAKDLSELEKFMVNSWNGAMVEGNDDMGLYFATFEGEF